ncbi:MAG: protein mobE [Methylococcaceae bacterium]
MMSELEDSFSKLLGRQATDSEKQQLYATKEALGLKNNDALWLILMALQHHQALYNQIPARIEKSANVTLNNIKEAADLAMSESARKATAAMAKAVAEIAKEVASDTSKKQKWQWATGCISVAFLSTSLLAWYVHSTAYQAGINNGYGTGYSEAKDQKAAAAWANTPEGQAAYKLAQAGSINALENCNKPGWLLENGVCFVRTAKDGSIYGWKIAQ